MRKCLTYEIDGMPSQPYLGIMPAANETTSLADATPDFTAQRGNTEHVPESLKLPCIFGVAELLPDDLISATVLEIGGTPNDGATMGFCILYLTKGGEKMLLKLGFDETAMWVLEKTALSHS